MGFSFFKLFQRKDKGKRSIAQVIRLLTRSDARGGPSITNPRGMFLVSTESDCRSQSIAEAQVIPRLETSGIKSEGEGEGEGEGGDEIMIHRAHPCMPASDSTAEEEDGAEVMEVVVVGEAAEGEMVEEVVVEGEEEDVEHLMIDIS